MVDIPVAIVGFAVVATGPATGRHVLDVTCGVALAPLALIDVAVVVRLALDRLYLAPPRSRRVVKLAADGVDILREGEVVLAQGLLCLRDDACGRRLPTGVHARAGEPYTFERRPGAAPMSISWLRFTR